MEFEDWYKNVFTKAHPALEPGVSVYSAAKEAYKYARREVAEQAAQIAEGSPGATRERLAREIRALAESEQECRLA